MRRLKYLFLKSFDLKTQVLIRVAIIGMVIGVIGVAFRKATEFLSSYFFDSYYAREHWWEWLFLPVICMLGGLFASAITRNYAQDASGSGIPQVKHALNTPGIHVRLRTAVVKFFGAVAGIASGLSLGREGPTIHMGAGIAEKMSQIMGGRHPKRALASGAGAGLAAAFNTPIAGVLFVIEELDHDFSSVSLGPAIVGSVSAAVTTRFLYGDFFTLHFASKSGTGLEMIPFYILVGILAGICGVYFQRGILWALDFYKNKMSALPAWSWGAIAGLITGLCGLWLPEAIGGGHATLEGTLAQAYIWWLLPIIFIFKFLLTLVAYGSGVPGGIFAPALVMGALMGACVGNLIAYIFPGLDINPATFAFVGMGAFFTGISRAPITSIVMLFELTGNYALVLPMMFACIIANITAEKLQIGSIYENLLEKDGIEIEEYSSPSYLQRFSVEQAMNSKVETVQETMALKEVYELFEHSDHGGFPVENSKGELTGIVTLEDVHKSIEAHNDHGMSLKDIMATDLKVLTPRDNLQTAILYLYEHKIGRLLVVDVHNPKKLIGIITRSDIINFEANRELDH